MGKYEPLEAHLIAKGHDHVPMTFAEIERVVGFSLPPSAYRHRAWWSNNPSNSVITHSWLNAGFHTASVDLAARRLTFVRRATDHAGSRPVTADDAPQYGSGDNGAAAASRPPTVGMAEVAAHFAARHALFGCLAGTVAYGDGADITQPADPEWAALVWGAGR